MEFWDGPAAVPGETRGDQSAHPLGLPSVRWNRSCPVRGERTHPAFSQAQNEVLLRRLRWGAAKRRSHRNHLLPVLTGISGQLVPCPAAVTELEEMSGGLLASVAGGEDPGGSWVEEKDVTA